MTAVKRLAYHARWAIRDRLKTWVLAEYEHVEAERLVAIGTTLVRLTLNKTSVTTFLPLPALSYSIRAHKRQRIQLLYTIA